MPTDPSAPKSPSRYQPADAASKGGGSGIFFVILLLVVVGGGIAYYFLSAKPAVVAATPAAAATPIVASPTPSPTATPDASTGATYSKAQRQQYIDTAIASFRELRQSKGQPFTEAFAALMSAGGFSSASLPSKDAIAARREMVQKCLAANDEYTAFIKNQEAAYTAELKKTPLVTNDVEVETSITGAKMPTDKIVQLRTLQNDSLKTGDQMLDYLSAKFGAWSVNADKHIVFKKSADSAPFSALAKTYSEQVASLNKLRDEINAVAGDDPTGSAQATSTTATASPAAAPSVAVPSPSATP